MLDYSIFSKNLSKLILNFGNLKLTTPYMDFMFAELKNANFSNEDFIKAINEIINNNKQLLCLPSKAVFLEAANKNCLTDNQKALLEVSKLINYAKYCYDHEVISDNNFLNQALHDYGGMRKLCWDINSSNPEKKAESWIKKELIDLYLANKAFNKGSMIPSSNQPIKSYTTASKGIVYEEKKIGIIGDRQKIQITLENNNQKLSDRIIDLTNKLKKI